MQSSDKIAEVPTPLTPQLGISEDINIPYILGVLRRNWLFPFIGCLIGLVAALTYIASKPSMYTSKAQILIDRSVNRYLQANNVIDEPVLDDNETGSQIYVLSSESIIVPVIRSMKLAHDPEFVGEDTLSGDRKNWTLNWLRGEIESFLSIGSTPQTLSEAELERIAVEEFLKRLSVYREDVPRVISVTFESEDAKKAADIVNAIVDRYLASYQAAKSKSTKIATQLLEEQLTELKKQTAESERRLQDFMRTNKLTPTALQTGSPEQLAAFRAQLSAALAQEAETKARLNLSQQETSGSVSNRWVPDNDVILKLQTTYLEYAAQAADISARVGENHAAVIKMREKMGDLQDAIGQEQKRISGRFQSDHELAKARSEKLAESLAQLSSGKTGLDAAAMAKLRELESQTDTLRKAYNNVLQRFSDIAKNDVSVSQDATAITRAAPPLRKSSRHALKALAGGLGLGLFLGFGVILGRELLAGVVRTPHQLREITDCYCAIVPAVKADRRFSLFKKACPNRLEEYVLDAPYSRFAEAFRNARVILTSDRQKRKNRGDVICVVSSVAKEGKTTVATNLGALMASNSKLRILLIDGDLHRRSLTRKLAPDAQEGLIQALQDPSRLASLIVKNERSGTHILPCPHPTRLPNAAELLGSKEMEQLIGTVRESYDFIIIEVPPIMSIVDVKMMEHHVDKFVLVVEWGRTHRRLVQEAMIEVDGIYDRLSCVMLNNVDPSVLKTIESYKGSKFDAYYEA